MNLRKFRNSAPPKYITGLDIIDQHIDIGKPYIVSICSDKDALTTSLLHVLAASSAHQGRISHYFDAAHNWNPELYGIPEDLGDRLSPILSNETLGFWKLYKCTQKNTLILYDTLVATQGHRVGGKYLSEFFSVAEDLRRKKSCTVVFTEHFKGYDNQPLTERSKILDFRISLRMIQDTPTFQTHRISITRAFQPEPFATSKITIPKGTGYHRFFMEMAGQRLGFPII